MIRPMEEQEVIKPSKRPWASPIVLVARKHETTCFSVHYRKFSAITKMDVYPLPRIDHSFGLLTRQHFFTWTWHLGNDRCRWRKMLERRQHLQCTQDCMTFR